MKDMKKQEAKRSIQNSKKVVIVDDEKQSVKISLFVKEKENIKVIDMKEKSFLGLKKKYSFNDIEVGMLVNGEPKTVFFGNNNFWVMCKSTVENAKLYSIDIGRLQQV